MHIPFQSSLNRIRSGLRLGLCLSAMISLPGSFAAERQVYDIVIYGGTSGGIAAAIQATRMGKTVVLVEPGRHLGGLTSGGLGATDIGNKAAIGGIAREFYERIHAHYAQEDAWKQETRANYLEKRGASRNQAPDPVAAARGKAAMWTFEPSVAERVFGQMLKEAGVPILLETRLNRASGVRKRQGRIVSIQMESGAVLGGKIFVDASYEGDLMASAGVTYHVGRESNATYAETLNGVQTKRAVSHQFKVPIDPYRTPGDPGSGLLPGIQPGRPGKEGSGDHRVQAYNFRLCLTDAPANRLPIPRPDGYDPLRYELFRRYLAAGIFDALALNTPMPNRKTDVNNHGAFSSDNLGMNYDYPDADYATRAAIVEEHRVYLMGLWWFLQNDAGLSPEVRNQARRWGLCGDEFTGTGGWPHQIYVREARRLVSDYVMTEHNCRGTQVAPDAVGLGAYNMDSHNVQRYVHEGAARNEGDIQIGVDPYPIAYRALTPRRRECPNLLVPVCLSASHIAFGSIRMEPVFMVLGQSAATAAALAIDAGVPVQEVDYGRLRQRLLADGQILAWNNEDEAREPEGDSPRKRVLLLGDSISIGYTPFVRKALADQAVVVRPVFADGRPENCAGTTHGVEALDRWLLLDRGEWDVIHFNFGLHDLKRVDLATGVGSANPFDPRQAPLPVYMKRLGQIVRRLERTGARLIFATTTPVPEGGVRPHRDPDDPERYNSAARILMERHDIAVNDLYAFALPRLDEIQQPVNVHFTPEGSRLLGGEVVRHVRRAWRRPAERASQP